jgi:hypothetical protein
MTNLRDPQIPSINPRKVGSIERRNRPLGTEIRQDPVAMRTGTTKTTKTNPVTATAVPMAGTTTNLRKSMTMLMTMLMKRTMAVAMAKVKAKVKAKAKVTMKAKAKAIVAVMVMVMAMERVMEMRTMTEPRRNPKRPRNSSPVTPTRTLKRLGVTTILDGKNPAMKVPKRERMMNQDKKGDMRIRKGMVSRDLMGGSAYPTNPTMRVPLRTPRTPSLTLMTQNIPLTPRALSTRKILSTPRT